MNLTPLEEHALEAAYWKSRYDKLRVKYLYCCEVLDIISMEGCTHKGGDRKCLERLDPEELCHSCIATFATWKEIFTTWTEADRAEYLRRAKRATPTT